MHDKYYHFSTYIALVLDLPVPVEVVDGVVLGTMVATLAMVWKLLTPSVV